MKLPQKHLYNKYYYFLLCCFSMIFYTISGYATENKKDLAIWPKAESGYKQIIIQLPPLKNEDLYRVELIPEKTMEKDCNHFMISGSFETKPLTGWGYEYYILNKIGMPASTKMACIPDTKNLTAISIQTDLPFIRYNSKIPLVTYIPKNIHLSYRIWSAGSLQNAESKR